MIRDDRPAAFGLRLVVSVILIALFAVSRAQATPTVDNNVLWVANSDGLLKVATADAQIILRIPEAKRVEALAVDEHRRVVWAAEPGHLIAYDFSGKIVHELAIPRSRSDRPHHEDPQKDQRGRPGFGPYGEHGFFGRKPVRLAVDGKSGDVWLSVENAVYRLDANGSLQAQADLHDRVLDMALDVDDDTLWVVGQRHTVVSVSATGVVSGPLLTGRRSPAFAITYDPMHKAFWIATPRGIVRVSTDGQVQLEVSLGHVRSLAADRAGGVWAVAGDRLLHIDEAGSPRVDLRPGWFGAMHGVLAELSPDPSDASVWVSSRHRVAHFSADGELMAQFDSQGRWYRNLIFAIQAYADVIPPDLAFTAPSDGGYATVKRPELAFSYSNDTDVTTLKLSADGTDLPVDCTSQDDSHGRCTLGQDLSEGPVDLQATVTDYVGNVSDAANVGFTVDTIRPAITISAPKDGLLTNQRDQMVTGIVSEPATVAVNGFSVNSRADNGFSVPVTLDEGPNTLTAVATDRAGNRGQASVSLTLDTTPPVAVGSVTIGPVVNGLVMVSAPAGSAESGLTVILINQRTGEAVTAKVAADGSFHLQIAALQGDTFSILLKDDAGNLSKPAIDQVPTPARLPSDPSNVAPRFTANTPQGLQAATVFLYEGANPIQIGVAPGTISFQRAAEVRGRVLDVDGKPLPGVQIAIKDHPELGETFTRADGVFDMAVNGGGALTVQYRHSGRLSAWRQINVPWQRYVHVDDVVLLKPAADSQQVQFGLPALQTVRGDEVTDGNGTRRATVLIPSGTTASMMLPDGSSAPLSTGHLRITEYTVGLNGRKAMPANLPPTSAYTYAVDFRFDEAAETGARSVQFNQPVAVYVDNYRNFPIGVRVPSGWYDASRGAWVPSDDGRIVKILDVTPAGDAMLDVDGKGKPAAPSELAALGVSAAELHTLAQLYKPGKSLWRVPVEHFSAYDFNWGWGFPDDATRPSLDDLLDQSDPKPDDCDCENGSIIETESQVLGERIPIIGTPFTLNYRSDRVPGRTAARVVRIPITDSQPLSSSLEAIKLQVDVAGRHIEKTFPAKPNQTYAFKWDGRDRFGRLSRDPAKATIKLGYVYKPVYYGSYAATAAAFRRTFGLSPTASAEPMISSVTGSGWASLAPDNLTTWVTRTILVAPATTVEPMDLTVGGWTVSSSHFYSSASHTLLLGDGGRRSLLSGTTGGYVVAPVVASDGSGSPLAFSDIRGLAVRPDGSVYVAYSDAADGTGVNSLGHITASGALELDKQDGVKVMAAGSDGSLAWSSGTTSLSLDRYGTRTYDGFGSADALTVQSDGRVYVADWSNGRIEEVTPDGGTTSIAGTGKQGFGGDGATADTAMFNQPAGLALGADGGLYVADTANNRIRRIGPDGKVVTIAGNGYSGYAGDGHAATSAELASPASVAVDPSGNVFIADTGNHAIREVTPDGVIHTVAGMDDGVTSPRYVAVGPGGQVYFANRKHIYALRHVLPDLSSDTTPIASKDGAAVYRFDAAGRILKTVDALTGVTLYKFTYDAAGALVRITDTYGNATTIERDSAERALAIVAPGGQRTALTLNADGYLARRPIRRAIPTPWTTRRQGC